MMWNDLKYCGTKTEVQLMQENTNIFNQEMARLCSAGKPHCESVTVEMMNKHLDEHDHTNPKRPLLKAMIRAKGLVTDYHAALAGITTDGTNTRVLRDRYTRMYLYAQGAYLNIAKQFHATCSYVNIHMLNETPLTGKPLHAIGGGASGNGAAAAPQSRHMALKKMTGTKMLTFMN
jgi:hypothetical protein